MKRAIILGKAAGRELEERLSYLRDTRPGAEERLAVDLARLLNLISEFPQLHAPLGRTLRKAVLEQWSLGVFYRSNARYVFVTAILDLRRDPTAIRRRLGLHEGSTEFVAGPPMALPSGISFSTDLRVKLPDRFNVAAPFIDRHIGEGRGAKAAIRTAHETVTYAELAERVNRAGHALLALGLKPGDRLLMVVKDCPAFFYLFWGAIKAGIVAVPPNTLLRAPDYAYMFEDSGCRLVVYSAEFAGEIEPALKQVPRQGADGRRLPRRHGEGFRQARSASRRAHRRLLLAVLLRLDRPAQGSRPCPSRHGGDQRALWRARAGRHRAATSATRPPSSSSPTAWATP